MTANAALYYDAEGFDTSRPKLMGRHAAGEGFLRGFARHARVETLYAYAGNRPQYDDFCRQTAAITATATEWLPHERPERLAIPGALFIPGPDMAPHAWHRRGFDVAGWSITGVTHTVCSHRAMDSIGSLLTAPVEEWDALICTSEAVLRGVEYMLAGHGEYLAERFGAKPVRTRAQLPVIPLGVDCDRFRSRGEVRKTLRSRQKIGAEDICVLFFGRLSYHAKAHPLPMYLALEAAAQATGRRIHLVQAGWFASDSIRDSFFQAAQAICPSVRVINVDGRKPEVRDGIWHAADVFCSLSDNVQETFGLTPLEAMAAGLPVVATDWNGYRGTVEPGVTGFLVPTVMPPPGDGALLARRHFTGIDNYDHYLGYVSQSIAVDVPATARAFIDLINNAELRRRMGEAGRERTRRLFDWSVIVARYQELWADLAARRAAARGGPRPVTLRDDPFAMFAHYATRSLDDDCRVETADKPEVRFNELSRLRMNRIGRDLLAGDEEIRTLIGRLGTTGPARVGELLENIATDRRAGWRLTLGWLAKMDVLRVVP